MDINDKITPADEEQLQIDLTSIPTTDTLADADAKQAEAERDEVQQALPNTEPKPKVQQKTNEELLHDINKSPNKSKAYLKRQGK